MMEDYVLFFSALAADRKLAISLLVALGTFPELVFSAEWTMIISFTETFSAELALTMFYPLLDEPFP